MRVLITTSTFPIRVDDGFPRFVYDLADALARRCEVVVLAPAAPGTPLHERMGGRVEVRRFRYFWPQSQQRLAYGHGMRDNLRASVMARLQPVPYFAAQTIAIRSVARRRRIQVVNSHWMIPQGLTTAIARGPRPRFRHVLSVHAADVYMLEKLPLGRAVARFIMSRTDHVFADGSHVRDRLDGLLAYPSNAVLQPMGVRSEIFSGSGTAQPIPSPFPDGYLLFFGRFAEKKGIVYLLRAMPGILDAHPGLGLILIGYGALEPQLKAEAVKLGIERSVAFIGPKSHAEIVGYLRNCKVTIVPSVVDSHGETDGMPTVVVEAMAGGARVVASAVDGIPDVVRHGENGWLCREKDPEDLAEKVLTALGEPAPSPTAQAALETAERFDWQAVAGRYAETFERLIAPQQDARD